MGPPISRLLPHKRGKKLSKNETKRQKTNPIVLKSERIFITHAKEAKTYETTD